MHRFVAVVPIVLSLGAGWVQPVVTQAPGRALALADHGSQRSVGDPQVSPDGEWIAFTVGTIDPEKDRQDTDIWMAAWNGSQEIRLTATSDTAESRPRWSPDGKYLAFLAARGDDEQKKKGAQVWVLNRLGGEAQAWTEARGGITEFEWSPDGKRLVLVVSDFDPASEPEKLDGWKRKTRPPIVIDRYQFKTDEDGYRTPRRTHLALFDVAAGKLEPLTSGPFDDREPAWSPDGKSIAFVSKRGPDPDRTEDTNIYVVEARKGAEARAVTTYPGVDAGPPAWSPDGRWIAYRQGDELKFSAYQMARLAVVSAEGGAARVLTAGLDRTVEAPLAWSADGSTIRATVEDDRAAQVIRVTVATGAVETLTSGRHVVSSISPRKDGAAAVLRATAAELPEVHALDAGGLRRVSHQNDRWLSAIRLATTEDFTCRAKDGTVVNGLIAKPAGFTAGRKYPTILYIHGGPIGQDDHSFDFLRELLAANGYLVVNVNYRGSSGRGSAFQKAIFGDWGNKEVVDLLAAVDHVVAAGLADPDRLGLGGWSYGGILTDYTIATDTRFKAAVSGASSALQLSMYGTDQYVVQYEAELGLPWRTPEPWLKVSYPFFHADRIKTPTLFLSGLVDFNVPTSGVEQMYQALRSLGVVTRLVLYPDQHHILTVPSYVRDRYQRSLEWWDRYLKR